MQFLELVSVATGNESRLDEDFSHLLDEDGVRFPCIRKHFAKVKSMVAEDRGDGINDCRRPLPIPANRPNSLVAQSGI